MSPEEKYVRELFQKRYGKTAKSCERHQVAKSASANVGSSAADPSVAYFGRVVASLRISASADKLTFKEKGANILVINGDINTGYTGPKYMPIDTPEMFFNYLSFDNTSTESTYVFTGWKLTS